MPFGQHSTSGVCQGHGERAPVLESQDEWRSNQAGNVFVRRQVECPLDSMRPGDRQSVPGKGLVPRDLVAHLTKHFTLTAQIPHTGVFLDEFHVTS